MPLVVLGCIMSEGEVNHGVNGVLLCLLEEGDAVLACAILILDFGRSCEPCVPQKLQANWNVTCRFHNHLAELPELHCEPASRTLDYRTGQTMAIGMAMYGGRRPGTIIVPSGRNELPVSN